MVARAPVRRAGDHEGRPYGVQERGNGVQCANYSSNGVLRPISLCEDTC